MTDTKTEGFLPGSNRVTPEKTPAEQTELKTTLERELDGEDSELAKELQRSRAEEIIARRRVAVERMRAGQNQSGVSAINNPNHGKEWLTNIAQGLLERGLDPSVVGRTIDYLLGSTQAPLVGLPGAPAPAQGMTFTDMKEIFKMGQEANRTDPAIAAILNKLSDKISDLEHKVARTEPTAKKSYLFVKPDGSVEEIEADKPIFIQPPAASGEPIDLVKEKNRHAEELEKIKIEKEYKEGMIETLSGTVEGIGRGLAADAREAAPPRPQVVRTTDLEKSECPECHAVIYHPREATQFKCSKCNSILERKTIVPQEAKS